MYVIEQTRPMPAAIPGIATGVILALSRAIGEAALDAIISVREAETRAAALLFAKQP